LRKRGEKSQRRERGKKRIKEGKSTSGRKGTRKKRREKV